jgi:hypothetical protein
MVMGEKTRYSQDSFTDIKSSKQIKGDVYGGTVHSK